MEAVPLRAYLVDDEPLAIERLARLLSAFDRIHIAGSATDPAQAVAFLNAQDAGYIDVVFLDIQMPAINGFDLLARLDTQPFVIFTTAYDEYALRAFEVNSIDYLVKPIEPPQLARALGKLDRIRPLAKPAWQQSPDLPHLLQQLAASLRDQRRDYPRRVASRVGERISFLDLDAVTHFIAHDKLTYAVVNGHRHAVDQTIADLERRLDPARFLRVHRSALVNADWIHEVNSWFAGKVVVSLKDPQRTQIAVARDRVRFLKTSLGIQ
ncbi:MAG: LytTR family DNA-binding domain-containing protein [Terracidiphilus sp.]|nr:LytTR family DNA-binding domain-containing protein [Terracidiphilus sp.]